MPRWLKGQDETVKRTVKRDENIEKEFFGPRVPGDGWWFVIAVMKMSSDYGSTRVLAHLCALIKKFNG